MDNNKNSDNKNNIHDNGCCSNGGYEVNQDADKEIHYVNKIKELEINLIEQEKSMSYLKADMENIRRNSIKEIQNAVNRQVHKIIMSFLNVLDDYERSLMYAKSVNQKELYEGLLITYNTFYKVLEELDVKEIDCGGEFNPEFHDAVTTQVDESKPSQSIFQVVQKGFLCKNKVVRPAKVIIVA